MDVAHFRHAHDQRGKHQRRDNHLDQPQKNIGQRGKNPDDRLHGLGSTQRQAKQLANDDAEDQRYSDIECLAVGLLGMECHKFKRFS